MLNPQTRRTLMSRPRPRTILLIALATVTAYFLIFSGPSPQLHVVPYLHEKPETRPGTPGAEKPLSGESGSEDALSYFGGDNDKSDQTMDWDIDIEDLRNWRDPDDKEDPDDVEPGFERDGKERDNGQIGRLQHEKDMRKMWRYVYKTTAKYRSEEHTSELQSQD